MTVNLTGSIDYTKWRAPATEINAKNTYSTTKTNKTEETGDTFVSSSSETCTDGKDDGKIGFWSAAGNALKGIGKTVWNGLKGMVTDSEGNFSLGKTLLSIGTVAACIAFPAVGVAACAVGATMGAVQVGKGIYNAATADTDAEAKQAWQDIGGGTFTVATSVLGAKAGMKAVKATSSAGGAKGVSALDKLDDTATLGQKASALGKDMLSSSKNRALDLKTTASTALKNKIQTGKDVKTLNQMKKANAEALAKQAKGEALTPDELKAISDWDNLKAGDYTPDAIKKANKQNTIDALKAELKEAKKSGNTDDIANAKNNLKEFYESNSKVLNEGKKLFSEAKNKITKENAGKLWDSLKNAPSNLKGKLSGIKGQIYEALTSGETNYAKAVQEYGYQNVAEVLQYVAGYTFANEAI